MKIVHLSLVGYPFIKSWGYQENELIKQNLLDGLDVVEITRLELGSYEQYLTQEEKDEHRKYSVYKDGLTVHRISFKKTIPKAINMKIRFYKGLGILLAIEKPDIIVAHDFQFASFKEVILFKKNNPKVKLYVVLHAEPVNSAHKFISKFILHKLIYKKYIFKKQQYIDKYLYLGIYNKEFGEEMYGLDSEKMEYYPIGGHILTPNEKERLRAINRKNLNLKDEDIFLVHSGKLDTLKKTSMVLDALEEVNSEFGDKLKLIIVGKIPEGADKLKADIKANKNVLFLGWKSAQELREIIASCDLYVQPGTPSSTFQTAICAGTPVIYDSEFKSYAPIVGNNGFGIKTKEDLVTAFEKICLDASLVRVMSGEAYKTAFEVLDYRKLAKKLYE